MLRKRNSHASFFCLQSDYSTVWRKIRCLGAWDK